METKRALDEQLCAQKDTIEATQREAIIESDHFKDVISGLDAKLQSTQRELERAIEARSRDTMLAEMREASARSLSGTIPQPPRPQPSIPADFVARFQDR